ncbi:MAG TPA: NRDE family protein [Desulfosalsimonadaceae bacterium]|nr:NRDE family protein [Desulfosalsimonadaceae bacterium]
MCLIAVAFHCHPDYPLILAANRDEFYQRPTAGLGFWSEVPSILGGRDLKSMGTWLAVSTTGRIGAVTNYRDPASLTRAPQGPSRGLLIKNFLTCSKDAVEYLKGVQAEKHLYEGFNLLTGSSRRLYWYSNASDTMEELSPGIHGISNHLLNTPWPKVEKIKTALAGLLQTNPGLLPEPFFASLSDQIKPADARLPDTGVGLEWERTLSPVFTTSSVYGTRSSSLIFIHRTGKVTFYERLFAPYQQTPVPRSTRCISFWPLPQPGEN